MSAQKEASNESQIYETKIWNVTCATSKAMIFPIKINDGI